MEHMAWTTRREASVLAVAGTGSAAASLGRNSVEIGESRWAEIWQFPCVFTVKFFAFFKKYTVVYFIIDM